MLKIHKDALTRKRVELVQQLIIDEDFLAHMMNSEAVIISESMKDDIEAKPTRSAKVSKFLEIIIRRGPDAMNVFIKALVYTHQEHLSNLLDPVISNRYIQERDQAERPLEDPVEETMVVDYGGSESAEKTFEEKLEEIKSGNETLLSTTPLHFGNYSQLLKRMDTEEVYEVRSQRRGRAVIISNSLFVKLSYREGNEKDLDNLRKLFERLQFDVDVIADKTAQEIWDFLRKEASNPYHKNADMFILCVLSHGESGCFFAFDEVRVNIEQIITIFDGNNCPALLGRPKVFFIQACQGNKATTGIPEGCDDRPDGASCVDEADSQEIVSTPSSASSHLIGFIHEKADTLLGMSTVPGYAANRNTSLGTLYIRCLVYVFSRKAHKNHVLDMLTEVNNIMSRFQTSENQVYACQKIDSLRRQLYLMPGFNGRS